MSASLFTGPAERPELVGARSRTTGVTVFPASLVAPSCTPEDMEEVRLPRRGRLWSWTIQGFPPKSPPYDGPVGEDFVPYGVGYVDLGDVVVEGRLTVADPDVLQIGREMEVVVVPFGDGASTYAFAPV